MMRTIQRDFRSETVIEKSRFICTLKKVASEEEALRFIKEVKKEFWDATHNCSAYVTDGTAQRSSDDGEPAGTAGVPMLEVLRKNQLTGVAVVVTRYFGGVKLGAGGLVRAYSGSVASALRQCGLAEKVKVLRQSFTCAADAAGRILNILYRQELFAVAEVDYGETVRITLQLRETDAARTAAWLQDNLNMQLELTEAGSFYEEQPLKI